MARLKDQGQPKGPGVVHVRIALPFSGGVVLATDGSAGLAKTPWGLLTVVGGGAGEVLRQARLRFRHLPPVGLARVHLELEQAWIEAAAGKGSRRSTLTSPDLVWLFSHEVDPLRTDDPTCTDPRGPAAIAGVDGWLGAPVGIYRDAGTGAVVSRWGAVMVVGPESGTAAGALGRDAELYAHSGLDRGVDLNSRLHHAMATVAWVLREVQGGWGESGEAPPGTEVVIGIHEAGHSYSVDRVSLSGLPLELPPYRDLVAGPQDADGGGNPPPPS